MVTLSREHDLPICCVVAPTISVSMQIQSSAKTYSQLLLTTAYCHSRHEAVARVWQEKRTAVEIYVNKVVLKLTCFVGRLHAASCVIIKS